MLILITATSQNMMKL